MVQSRLAQEDTLKSGRLKSVKIRIPKRHEITETYEVGPFNKFVLRLLSVSKSRPNIHGPWKSRYSKKVCFGTSQFSSFQVLATTSIKLHMNVHDKTDNTCIKYCIASIGIMFVSKKFN